MSSWAPSLDQIHARIPTTGNGFDATSEPSAQQVEELISQTIVDVVADIGQFDPAVVVNASQVEDGDAVITLADVARVTVIAGVSWRIERAWHREQPVGGEDDETRLFREWVDSVERLRKLVATTRPQPTVHRLGTIGIRAPLRSHLHELPL